MKRLILLALLAASFVSCDKEEETTPPTNTGSTPSNEPKLIFKFRFDETQPRLDNLGNPATVPAGNAAQTPLFHQISAHYIEMTNGPLVQLGDGEVLYVAPETTAGGTNAINFSQSVVVGEDEVFFEIPIAAITPDTYRWMRVSLAYQNYDIEFMYDTWELTGRLASFVGFNTYIENVTIDTQNLNVGGNRLQGFWAMEVPTPFGTFTQSGQAPAGATTVPNPLSATSPIPAGSCVVTGEMLQPLQITGNETEDIVVILSLSANQSFEWQDLNGNGVFEPQNEPVVDMGLRGLIPFVEN